MGIENPVHLIFIGVVALLVLGPKRLPAVARSLGHSLREFRAAMNLEGENPIEQPVVHTQPPVVAEPAVVQHPPLVHAQPVGEGAPVAAQALDVLAAPTVRAEAPPGPAQVDPARPLRSADAPDRRAL